MPYSYSDNIPDKSVCDRVPQDTLIEVYVWEAFTVKRTVSYSGYLAEHSFDRGPVEMDNLPPGRTCYRFTPEMWSNHIRSFLIQHWIPVSIRMVSRAVVAQFH